MENVVGVFAARAALDHSIEDLRRIGVTSNQINVLLPGSAHFGTPVVADAESPGVGTAIGAVVGGASGAFAGLTMAIITLPGVGAVTVIGLAAAALAGAVGAVAGAAVGEALESVDAGIPIDEAYVYEDALRKGRIVVLVQASTAEQADAVRDVLVMHGAESVDAARDQWWTGLRSAEEAEYEAAGGDFGSDEEEFRRGFAVAQSLAARGKSYLEALPDLRVLYPHAYQREAFRHGFERGRLHRERLMRQFCAEAERSRRGGAEYAQHDKSVAGPAR